MQQGHYVFSQVMAHLPLTTFRRCVARYRGEHKIKDRGEAQTRVRVGL
jgi:hypothetical protein